MCQNNQSHSHPSSLLPIVPRTAAALPLCTATEILCRRNSWLQGFLVDLQRRLLRSLTKSTAASPNTPDVSTTKGTKWWLVSRCAYLATFNCSACAATMPGNECVLEVKFEDDLIGLEVVQVESGCMDRCFCAMGRAIAELMWYQECSHCIHDVVTGCFGSTAAECAADCDWFHTTVFFSSATRDVSKK